MGKSELLPLAAEVTLQKPYLCGQCWQVIQAGKKAIKRQIALLGPAGETLEVVACYTHSGECPPKLEKKVVWATMARTCHECRRVIKAGQQAAVYTVGRRRKPLYEHFPYCPPPEVEEAVTLDRPRPCAKCSRIIPAGNQAVQTRGTVLDRWENPIEVATFRHPSCPKSGKRVRYGKRGEMAL